MTMSTLKHAIGIVAFTWIAMLAFIILSGCLTRSIVIKGLLRTKAKSQVGGTSPTRAQLMVVTIAAGMMYLMKVIQQPHAAQLPEFDARWLSAVGASNAIYVIAKGSRFVRDRFFRP